MALNSVRNYLHKRNVRLRYEWKQFQLHDSNFEAMSTFFQSKDFLRVNHGSRNKTTERERMSELQSTYDRIKQSLLEKNLDKKEPYEYFTTLDETAPDNRLPSPGIRLLPKKFHKGRTVTVTESTTEEGYPLHPLINYLIRTKYPQYMRVISEFCRPLGTTDATFADFNKEQRPSNSFTPNERDAIIKLVTFHLDAHPYQPIHFVDTLYAGMPLSTGTGYHNRHSFKIRANAKYSHPPEYADKPTSKGYVANAVLDINRTLVHRIKYTGIPLDLDSFDLSHPEFERNLLAAVNTFIDQYPTLLFTRNYVSIRGSALKQRPVYAVDEHFLSMECMLTFPLHLQARRMSCAIMYSLETIRGSNVYLDKVAQRYLSYFTADWSSFDQTIPFPLVETFWFNFLPSLLVVNAGYHATYEYPSHPSTDADRMAMMLNNLFEYLFFCFKNMTFLSQDGYAYRRTYAGIPSGMLNTQYLDSYCNLLVMIHAMREFGISHDEIRAIRFFIMGDDNFAFTQWPISKVQRFVEFLETFAYDKYHMTLNLKKTVVTDQRQDKQTLSYECNFGYPRRPIAKLLAQLCYPEHGHVDKYMSMRAIGIAYASCGQNRQFYELCKDVFHTFLPYAEPMTPDTIAKMKKYLPGIFKLMDETPHFLQTLVFPSLNDIINEISTWKGELPFSPKWNLSHFVHSPMYRPENFQTLLQYNINNGVNLPTPPTLTLG